MAQRGKKPSMPQFPGDFIALGAKSGKFHKSATLEFETGVLVLYENEEQNVSSSK